MGPSRSWVHSSIPQPLSNLSPDLFQESARAYFRRRSSSIRHGVDKTPSSPSRTRRWTVASLSHLITEIRFRPAFHPSDDSGSTIKSVRTTWAGTIEEMKARITSSPGRSVRETVTAGRTFAPCKSVKRNGVRTTVPRVIYSGPSDRSHCTRLLGDQSGIRSYPILRRDASGHRSVNRRRLRSVQPLQPFSPLRSGDQVRPDTRAFPGPTGTACSLTITRAPSPISQRHGTRSPGGEQAPRAPFIHPAQFKNNRGDGVATYSKRWTIATSSPSISVISTATVVGSARTGNPG
jgi:hypothetical protein